MPNTPRAGRPLIPWLAGKKPVRVAVIGDVILDEYLDGQVTRISPEAPVPVHLVTKTFHGAGGAANVARNIKLAGGEVALLGVIGNDEAGRNLEALLKKDKVDCTHLITVHDRPTIRKTRITANSQHQLVRVDWERVHPIDMDIQEKILAGLKGLECDALLISDYAKGALPMSLLSNAISYAKSRNIPVIVGPKGNDYTKYLHATLVVPNRKEACEALGLETSSDLSGEELGRRLRKTYGLENVLVTLGPKGMVLVPKDGPAIEVAATAREVFDVSGAGDTVVSMMTLAMACQAPMAEAMHVANTAAGLVVGKWGTQPIQLIELEAALRQKPEAGRQTYSSQDKITNKETLLRIIKEPKGRSKKVVFTNGCFDLMHSGHVSYLEEARSLGDMLIVGVNTDESVRMGKDPSRPIVPLDHRMRVLAALGCVDHVVAFSEETPHDLIAFLVPDVLVKGADYDKDAKPGNKKYIVGSDTVRQAGGTVETIALVDGQSTSSIVARILALKS